MSRVIAVGLLISSALAGACLGDDDVLHSTQPSAQERAGYESTALAYMQILANHLGSPPQVDGLTGSKALSPLDRLDLLQGALWEESVYRASTSLGGLLSIGANGEFDGDWRRVDDPLEEPFRAICKLELRTTDGRRAVGTGFLVGPKLVMTCGKNIRDFDEIVVIPGATGAQRPFGSAVAIGGTYYEAPEGTAMYDIGWIFLPDQRLYNRVGYTFGLRAPEDAGLKALNASVAGYSGAHMKVDSERGAIKQVAPLQFYHDLDTDAGTRGAPVFSSTKDFAVGIQILEAGTKVRHNQACRLTAERIRKTKELIRDGGP